MKKLFSLFLIITLLASCSKSPLIHGEGEMVTRNFNILASVDRMYASGNFHIVLDSSIPEGVVSVTAPQNILDYLQITDVEEELKLGLVDGYRYDIDRIMVRMSPAGFDTFGIADNSMLACSEQLTVYSLKVSAQDGSEVLLQDVKSKNVDVVALGNSLIRVKGVTIDLTIEASGKSEVDTHELLCLEADVLSSGNSFVSVFVSGDLDIVCSGGSEIHYFGDPISVDVQSTGDSTIKKC